MQEALGRVVGLGEHDDVYPTVGGKWVDLNSTLTSGGITPDCTVYLQTRLRGGSRENVPGQWTCTSCNAQRCWPVRTRCCWCGEIRTDSSAPWNGRGKGKAHWVVALRRLQAVCRPRRATDRASERPASCWGRAFSTCPRWKKRPMKT